MAYSTRSSGERRHRLAQQVAEGVRVGTRLDVRLHREVAAVGHELTVAQLHPVALHLDHRDALAGMGEHDVELVVAVIAHQPDVGHHDPVVAQAVPQRLDDLALLVVGQRAQREVIGYEQPHVASLHQRSSASTPCRSDSLSDDHIRPGR